METSCEIKLAERFGNLLAREEGAKVRELVLDLLKTHRTVSIDMRDMKLTPSFVDECFGFLVQRIGLPDLKQRVKITNLPEGGRPLVIRVISRRSSQSHQAEHGLEVSVPTKSKIRKVKIRKRKWLQ